MKFSIKSLLLFTVLVFVGTSANSAPSGRVAPVYPQECQVGAQEIETVFVEFDVTVNGDVENEHVIDSSNDCFHEAALTAVMQWKFTPRVVDGNAIGCLGLQTSIKFILARNGHDVEQDSVVDIDDCEDFQRQRGPVSDSKLVLKIYLLKERLDDGEDPDAILTELTEIEEAFKEQFTPAIWADFLRTRGSAKILLGDIEGALEDLTEALEGTRNADTRAALEEAIAQLEAYVRHEELF